MAIYKDAHFGEFAQAGQIWPIFRALREDDVDEAVIISYYQQYKVCAILRRHSCVIIVIMIAS